MAEPISRRELRNNSDKIMSELDNGKSFIVTRNGDHQDRVRIAAARILDGHADALRRLGE